MISQQAVEIYRNVAVETAHPLKLVIMAYQGAVAALDRAATALEQKDYRGKSQEIQKAVGLVSELLAALDMEKGGQIARAFSSLYAYFLKRLLEADVRKDKKAIQEVRSHLAQLLEAWEELSGEKVRMPSKLEQKSKVHMQEARP